MKTWNNLVNTALLGTGKKQAAADAVLPALQPVWETIQQQAVDEADAFLQLTALTDAWQQSGVQPLPRGEASCADAPAEEKPYCNNAAARVLKDILAEENALLLEYWLLQCAAKQQLLPAEHLPAVLAYGENDKRLRIPLSECCGKRGLWLGDLNPAWQFTRSNAPGDADELWQHGTLEQRKKLLEEIRRTDAAKAREWLMQTWAQENAATRVELLARLQTNTSEEDLPWLQSLLQEKSQKVKDEALRLLKRIPGSAVVQLYWSVLQQAIRLQTEKTFLGLLKSTKLNIALPAEIDEAVFKTGIEKLSNNNKISDEAHILDQLVAATPPTCWEQHLGLQPEAILQLLQANDACKPYVHALLYAARRFNDVRWILAIAAGSETFYPEMLEYLPAAQQDAYIVQYFNEHTDVILRLLGKLERKWTLEITRLVFAFTARQPYVYNRNFYEQNIRHIHEGIVPELEKCAPEEQYSRKIWQQISHHISKLVSLKQQTIRAFNQ